MHAYIKYQLYGYIDERAWRFLNQEDSDRIGC